MKDKGKGMIGKATLLAAVIAVLGTAFATVAFANNLDRLTATNAAKQVAKKDCWTTSGCEDYFVRGLHRVSRHKAVGKIHVISHKTLPSGERHRFDCTRQIVIKLNHFTGDITYAVSKRRCRDLGLA